MFGSSLILPDLCKQFLSHFCRVLGLFEFYPQFGGEVPDELDTFRELVAGNAIAVMLVPDLHAMLLRNEDVCVSLKRDRLPEQDTPLYIDLVNLDPVCLRHF